MFDSCRQNMEIRSGKQDQGGLLEDSRMICSDQGGLKYFKNIDKQQKLLKSIHDLITLKTQKNI